MTEREARLGDVLRAVVVQPRRDDGLVRHALDVPRAAGVRGVLGGEDDVGELDDHLERAPAEGIGLGGGRGLERRGVGDVRPAVQPVPLVIAAVPLHGVAPQRVPGLRHRHMFVPLVRVHFHGEGTRREGARNDLLEEGDEPRENGRDGRVKRAVPYRMEVVDVALWRDRVPRFGYDEVRREPLVLLRQFVVSEQVFQVWATRYVRVVRQHL